MKWSELPWWAKALIIIFCVVLVYHVVKELKANVESHKNEWYRKWLATQREIRDLVFEKNRIERLIKKAQKYARITLFALKVVLLFAFAGFTNWLVYGYQMDVFSAVATAGGTVVTSYCIIAAFLNLKIRYLNELLAMANEKLEYLFQRRLKAEPLRVMEINVQLELLRKEASQLKEHLHS
jgi:hypothetical protein